MRRAYIFVTVSFENAPSRKAEFESEKSTQKLILQRTPAKWCSGGFESPRRIKRYSAGALRAIFFCQKNTGL
jgi:hypothetical protein